METIHITNSKEKVSDHFTMYEYWKPFFGSKGDFHTPKALINGIEFLRVWFDFPMIITSVYRPSGKLYDVHSDGLAADVNPIDSKLKVQMLDTFKTECLNYINQKGSTLIDGLRNIGITGFGIEGKCIHLDCRNYKMNRADAYGQYQIFQYEVDKDGIVIVNKSL
jgi:hypothetical protein